MISLSSATGARYVRGRNQFQLADTDNKLAQFSHHLTNKINRGWVQSGPDGKSIVIAHMSLDGSKLLPFKNDGDHCVYRDLQCCRHFLYPSPDMYRHSPVSELYGQFLRPHGLFFSLTCTVNCGTLYRQVCPFQIMSNQLHFPQVDSNQVVETSEG